MMEDGEVPDVAGIDDNRTLHPQPSVESPPPTKRYKPREILAITATGGNEEVQQENVPEDVPEDVRYITNLNVERCPDINRSQLIQRLIYCIKYNHLIHYSEKTSCLSEEDNLFFYYSIKIYNKYLTKNTPFAVISYDNYNVVLIAPQDLEKNEKYQSDHTKNERFIHRETILLSLIEEEIGCNNNVGKVYIKLPYSPCPHRKDGGSCMRDIFNKAKEWDTRYGIKTKCVFNKYYGINGTTGTFWDEFLKEPLNEILEDKPMTDKSNIGHVILKEFLGVLKGSLPVQKPLKISKINNEKLQRENMQIHLKEFRKFLKPMKQRLNQESPDSLDKYYKMADSKSEFFSFWKNCCKELYREHCKEIFTEKFNKIIFEYTLDQNERPYLQFGFLGDL
ncbi:uncharacterized protein LOC125781332 [Astyanax mexicanus]|uniref:uncharacterized protein LOC125781332 n=1 Tax=Astyanax mexicanus TaxID=7994 RepID=UPI0020CAF96B|nr:uncharacterized protein LOC125781332 [Astyanax mexicanus]XP_049321106.1 uncharacterized protein LOC125781332 [Astyanax mexicanus]